MSKPPKILVVGSVNIDFVIRTKRLPAAGETIGGGVFSTVPGGKGANQAYSACRLGAEVAMSACVGSDAFADIALSNLSSGGVDLKGVIRKSDVATGAAFINVSDDGENQIAVASGANAVFEPGDLVAPKVDAIIAQLEVPEEVVWRAIKDNDTFFCLNAAPAIPLQRRASLAGQSAGVE